MLLAEGVHTAAGGDELLEAGVRVGDRVERLVGPVPVRVVVVVGQREEQEVVEVRLDELRRAAGRVLVAGPGRASVGLQGTRRLA